MRHIYILFAFVLGVFLSSSGSANIALGTSADSDCRDLLAVQTQQMNERRFRNFLFSGPMLIGQNYVRSTHILNLITYQGKALPPGQVQLEIQEMRIPYSNKVSISLGLTTTSGASPKLETRVDEIAPFNLIVDSDFNVTINARGRSSPVTVRFPKNTLYLHSAGRTWILGYSLWGHLTNLEIIEQEGERKILMPLLHPTAQSTRRPEALFVRYVATSEWQNKVRKFISSRRAQILAQLFPLGPSEEPPGNEIASLLGMSQDEWDSIHSGTSKRRFLELWHVVVLARRLKIPVWDIIGFLAEAPQTVRYPRLKKEMPWLSVRPRVSTRKEVLKTSLGLRQAEHFKNLFDLLGSEHKLNDLAIVLEADIELTKKILSGKKLIRLSQAVFLASYLGVDVRDLLAFLEEYEVRN